jgi:DNA-binding CsgD family transcriptional regulator
MQVHIGTSAGGLDVGAYATLIDTLGTAAFEEAVLTTFRRLAGVVEVFACQRTASGDAPQLLLLAGHGAGPRAAAYCGRYYRQDPLNDRLSELGDRSTAMMGLQVSRDDIIDSRYRQECYVRPGFAGKLSLVASGRGGWTFLNLYRGAGDGLYGGEEVPDILMASQILLPLLVRHRQLVSDKGADRSRMSVETAEGRLCALYPTLTGRERAICARTVIGMTAEGIALDLGIKRSSVLTYRRRAYERMNISSALQLSACLFGM